MATRPDDELAPSITETGGTGDIASGAGGFLQGIINNFTGDNETGTGMGAIIGTGLLAVIGFFVGGGIPGLLIGGAIGALGGGLLNQLASGVMEWMGVHPSVQTMGGDTPRAKPDQDLANIRGLDVNQPGRDAVRTSTIAPRPEGFRDLEQLSEDIHRRREGGVDLGTAMINEIQDIRKMAPGEGRTGRMEAFWRDRNKSIQFMEDIGRWNELSGQWRDGDRVRLQEANKQVAHGLALPELEVPQALIFHQAQSMRQMPQELIDEVTGGNPTAIDSFKKMSRGEQLQRVYSHIDNGIGNTDLNKLAQAAKPGGFWGAVNGGRSFRRTGWAVIGIGTGVGNWATGNGYEKGAEWGTNSNSNGEGYAWVDSTLNNSNDAVHQIARLTELSPNAAADVGAREKLRVTAEKGLEMLNKEDDNHTSNAEAKRKLFNETLKRVRLEGLRDKADQYFVEYINVSEQGYNDLVKSGKFEGYAASVEEMRAQVNQRNARVQELNQSKLRFTERGGPDENHKWVTVQDDSKNPPKVFTLVAEKQGADWVVTHAYKGDHLGSKDNAADTAVPPLKMGDIFTEEGVMNTQNIGKVIRDGMVKLSTVPALELGPELDLPSQAKTNLTAGTVVAPTVTGPGKPAADKAPPAVTGP